MNDERSQNTAKISREIDIAPLRRLLLMAGPVEMPAIIAAFLDDLKSTETGLASAWNGPDCAALRMHSHVLIALAGTVGDIDLQADAQRLNALAHDQDPIKIHAMKAQTMRGLTDLILTLAALTAAEE